MEAPDIVPADLTLTGLGVKAGSKVARALFGMSSASTKDELGRVLSSQGARARAIMEALLTEAERASRGARAIEAVVANPALIGASAPAYGRR